MARRDARLGRKEDILCSYVFRESMLGAKIRFDGRKSLFRFRRIPRLEKDKIWIATHCGFDSPPNLYNPDASVNKIAAAMI